MALAFSRLSFNPADNAAVSEQTCEMRLPATSTTKSGSWAVVVVMAVSATLLAIGVPSYRSMIENQRASSTMHLLTAYMASARGTAISYRIPTVVCPSNRAGGCRMDGDWSQGWLMFFDADGNRQPDAREDILRDENAPLHPSLRLVSSSGRPQLRYLPDGRSAGSNISVRLCRGDVLLGQVIVNNVGRVRSEKASGSKPCMP